MRNGTHLIVVMCQTQLRFFKGGQDTVWVSITMMAAVAMSLLALRLSIPMFKVEQVSMDAPAVQCFAVSCQRSSSLSSLDIAVPSDAEEDVFHVYYVDGAGLDANLRH